MNVSIGKKVVTCSIAGLVCAASFIRIAGRFLGKWMSPPVIFIITVCILLASLFYAVKWAAQKNVDESKATLQLAFWQAVMRYGIAFDLIMFGLQKYFRLQFSMPLGLLDLPFSSFSGEDLTFAYFARSFGFVVVIGSLQIAGSVLLLFNKTKLAGVVVLVPVMLNIVLLNIFYKIGAGELIHSSVLLAALLYLLLSEDDRLVEFFFQAKRQLPSVNLKNQLVKNSVRYSAIYIPLLLVAIYDFPEKHPALYGRYAVTGISINGQTMPPADCTDSVLTIVYFDQNADCVFEYNDQNKRLIGNYHLDEKTNKMTVVWRYPAAMHDTLHAVVSGLQPNLGMTLSGKMGKQALEIELTKKTK